jgi:flagellar biosynthesis protein FlhA
LDRVVMIRRQCALEMGLVVPTIRIRDNIQLKPNSYVIKLKGVEVAKGELLLDYYMAMNPGTVSEVLTGISTVEPAFGLPAIWIQEANRERAELAGYTVVDPVSVLATHLTEIIKTHAAEIIGRQETQALIESIKQTNPAVVDEITPSILSLGDIQKVLANLLSERVSIRDMVTILETLGDYAPLTKDTEILSEYARQALARQISRQYIHNNVLACLTLDPQLENNITAAVQRTDRGSYVALDPQSIQAIINSLNIELPKLTSLGYQPVILTNPAARLHFRKLTQRIAPNLVVLSYAELDPKIEVQALGTVKA